MCMCAVVLCALLLLVCVLAVLYRRKRNRKMVAPRGQVTEVKVPREQLVGEKTNGTGNMHWDTRTSCQTSFTGARAKSANAILFTSPFGVSGKDHEVLSEDKQKEEETGGSIIENVENVSGFLITSTGNADRIQNSGKNTPCSPSVTCDNVPYLSIGSHQNEPNHNDKPPDKRGQRSKLGQGIHRISTWPPTAVQWQERCKRQSEQEAENGLTIWTQTEGFKVSSDAIKAEYLPSVIDQDHEKSQEQTAEIQDDLKRNEMHVKAEELSRLNDTSDHVTGCSSTTDKTDPIFSDSFVNQEVHEQNQDLKLEGNTVQKMNAKSEKTLTGCKPRAGLGSKPKGETRRSSSKAPSGGTSPNDETLLDGNEYVFMDLLHEVVQNHGRWTRDRWRQIHMKSQRLGQQGQQGQR